MKARAAFLAAALVSGVLLARAEDTLPPGLVRSGGVIMMRPISDGETSSAISSHERRPGTIRVLSSSDRELFTRAFIAADRSDWVLALSLAAQGHDATARKLVELRRLLDKNSGATFSDIDSFIKSNPGWPLRDTLFQRAETAMGPELNPAGVVAWFGGRTPVSSLGKIKLGEALIGVGRAAEGKALIRDGWRGGVFEPPQEAALLQKDGAYLTSDDDQARLDNLLWRDQVGDAKRELSRVDARAARIGDARISLRSEPGRAVRIFEKLSPSEASDPGLAFDRARNERRVGNTQKAESLFLRLEPLGLSRAHPQTWWSETNAEARQALQDKDNHLAYELAAKANLPPGEEYAESEFLAGWIALRLLNQPGVAFAHFQRLNDAVGRPISKARGHYWLGRAFEAEGDLANAGREYQAAARASHTFYGQLALARVEPQPVLHCLDTAVEPFSQSDFEKEDLTGVMEVLADLGDETLLRSFAMKDLETFPSAPHAKLLAQRLVVWGFPEIALHVAKEKSYDGVMMFDFTYPVITLPAFRGPGAAPEPALVLALIRQETEFDPGAVSGPGARGIMQVMPESAQKAAREAGLPYRPNDLLSDPSYNIQLGMTELAGHSVDWAGSYVLAAAAYNAGNHNVEKWVAAFGDPRSPNMDPVDWIEEIPFSETRNYVQRVLENIEVYRSRLAGGGQPLQVLTDLYRPNPPVSHVVQLVTPQDHAPSQTTASDGKQEGH